jgi:hypothetical protein
VNYKFGRNWEKVLGRIVEVFIYSKKYKILDFIIVLYPPLLIIDET